MNSVSQHIDDDTLGDIGEGLVVRRGSVADTEALADFQASEWKYGSRGDEPESKGEQGKDDSISVWTRDLMSGSLSNVSPSDFTIVEDTRTGQIVSSLNLISQIWSYDGIHFPVGRIELVATHPDYRRRGLVRSQINIVQEWSAERGELLLGITGIPWFYRQFGYEMALEQNGSKFGESADIQTETQGYKFRPAVKDDLDNLTKIYKSAMGRYLVSSVRDKHLWKYELVGRSEGSAHRHEILIIERTDGDSAGYLMHQKASGVDTKSRRVTGYELVDGVSWQDVTPAVLEYMQRDVGHDGDTRRIQFSLGTSHPSYDFLDDSQGKPIRPYAWYLRVPDMASFLRHIGSVLESRIEKSHMNGYTGDIKISFVGDGVRIQFEMGQLVGVCRWIPEQSDSRLAPKVRDAMYPGLTFLQVLFGFRSVDEIEYAFPDCILTSDQTRQILDVMFPKNASWMWGLE